MSGNAFLQRLYATPFKASDFIVGCALPMLPIVLAQSCICCLAAICLGLPVTVNILYALLFILPVALFFIGIEVLFGGVLNVKSASGVCGELLTNLSAWLSGTWFDLSLVGEGFQSAANVLPFVHAVELERALLNGDFAGIFSHLYVVAAYAIIALVGAILLFLRQMKAGK